MPRRGTELQAESLLGAAYLRGGAALTCTAALGFMVLRAGLAAWMAALALLPAIGLSMCLTGGGARPARDRRERMLIGGLILLVVAWLMLLFGSGAALPPGDAVAVPQFAQAIAGGRLLTQAYPPGSSGHAYPLGYPILLAPLMAWLPPIPALAVFKLLTVAVVAATPAAWAWLQRRLFTPELSALAVTAAAYAAFMGLERTLVFLIPFAGKNAVMLGVLLFPAVVAAAVELARSRRLWPLGALPMFGLVLVHYSMLHLLAAVLGGYVVVGLASRRIGPGGALRLAAMGAATVVMLLILNGEALGDPRAGGFAVQPLSGLGRMLDQIVARRPALVIFTDLDFGLPAPSYRLLQLGVGALVSALLAWRLREPGLRDSALVWLLALTAVLAMAFGVLPAGITLDFVRAFAWSLQAAIFMVLGLALLEAWRKAGRPWRIAGGAVAALAALYTAWIVLHDGRAERGAYRTRAVSRSALVEIQAVLPRSGGLRRCLLIGQSRTMLDGLVTVQKAGAWTYAEILSPCRFVNGSWIERPLPGARDLAGFPSAQALAALPGAAELLFVGEAGAFEAWRAAVAGTGEWRWQGAAGGASVWRRTEPPAQGAAR